MVHWFKRYILTALLGLVCVLSTGPAPASQQIFMNVEGVPGESTDSQHLNWIDINSFNHGISNFRIEGRTNSAPTHVQIRITKPLDKSSPTLAKSCASGKHFPLVKLEFINGTNAQAPFYQIGLSNAFVTNLQQSDSPGSDARTEILTFAYERIDWTYTQFGGKGVPLGDIKTFWDLILNIGNLDIPIRVSKITLEDGGARLTWTSLAGKTYTIMSSPSVTGPYNFLTTISSAGDGETSTVVSNRLASEFFIVITQ
jgi:type VI secretion system secreted protein Hcp